MSVENFSLDSGMPTRFSALLSGLDAVFWDQWGVLHDGVRLLPGVTDVLKALACRGIPSLIISNSSRDGVQVRQDCYRLGIDPSWLPQAITSADVLSWWLASSLLGDESSSLPALPCLGASWFLWDDDSMAAALLPRYRGLFQVASWQEADFLVAAPDGDHSRVPLAWWHKLVQLPLLCPQCPQNLAQWHDSDDGGEWVPGSLGQWFRKRGGTTLVPHKPFPPIFRVAQQWMERQCGRPLLPHRLLMVGDSSWQDISGARALGWSTLLLSPGGWDSRAEDTQVWHNSDDRRMDLVWRVLRW